MKALERCRAQYTPSPQPPQGLPNGCIGDNCKKNAPSKKAWQPCAKAVLLRCRPGIAVARELWVPGHLRIGKGLCRLRHSWDGGSPHQTVCSAYGALFCRMHTRCGYGLCLHVQRAFISVAFNKGEYAFVHRYGLQRAFMLYTPTQLCELMNTEQLKGGVPCAVRALCTRCAKSRPFSTTSRQFFGCRIAAGYYCHCVSV